MTWAVIGFALGATLRFIGSRVLPTLAVLVVGAIVAIACFIGTPFVLAAISDAWNNRPVPTAPATPTAIAAAPAKPALPAPGQPAQPAPQPPPAGGGQQVGIPGGIVSQAPSWCSGTACSPDRFVQLKEANGVINPYGVVMNSGSPVVILLPAGVTADVWDCFKDSEVTGPSRLPQVCRMTVRQNSY